MKNVFRKLLTLGIIVIMITAMMPTTTSFARVRRSYPELSPKMEKHLEEFYWEVLLGRTHVDTAYFKGADGFILRDEVQIVAKIILEEMDPYPAGEPGDVSAREWQRHWGDFFWNISIGNFSDRTLSYHVHRVQRKAKKYWHVPLW